MIELNNEDPYEAPNLPMGRDKVKRKLKGGQSSSSEADEIRNDIKGLDSKFEKYLEVGKERERNCVLKFFF